jgi:hypothetical protein
MTEHNGRIIGGAEPNDFNLLVARVHELIGQQCVAWRKSYGQSGSLHFGPLVAARVPRAAHVYGDRGTWVVSLWECDRTLSLPDGNVIDSTRDGDEALLSCLGSLEGTSVTDMVLDRESLSLTIGFASGARLALLTDSRSGKADEQWAIETLHLPSISVFGDGHWAVEE